MHTVAHPSATRDSLDGATHTPPAPFCAYCVQPLKTAKAIEAGVCDKVVCQRAERRYRRLQEQDGIKLPKGKLVGPCDTCGAPIHRYGPGNETRCASCKPGVAVSLFEVTS